MKKIIILSMLAVCACQQQPAYQQQPNYYAPEVQNPYYTAPQSQPAAMMQPTEQVVVTTSASQQAVPVTVSQVAPSAENPYALEPPAYADENYALKTKQDEVFAKEKALLEAQQELYNREKTLANREADFLNRSKALSYKERMLQEQQTQPVQEPVTSMPAPRGYATNVYVPPAPSVPPVSEFDMTFSAPQPVYQSQSMPAEYEQSAPTFIILQHPIQRDLVRCPTTDDVCLRSYERLGYERSANLSRFTAQDDQSLTGDYLQGKWRENNTIPRW